MTGRTWSLMPANPQPSTPQPMASEAAANVPRASRRNEEGREREPTGTARFTREGYRPPGANRILNGAEASPTDRSGGLLSAAAPRQGAALSIALPKIVPRPSYALSDVLSPRALDQERIHAFAAVGVALSIDVWPAVPVQWNRRLRRAGRAVIERRGGRSGTLRAVIALSPAYFDVFPVDLPWILIHESVHVGLALLRRPFGHGPAFRRACLAAGGRLHSRPMPGRVWRYRCPVCSRTLERRRRPSGDRWCAPCAGAADREGLPTFTRERALVLVGIRFSAGEVERSRSSADGADGPPMLVPERRADGASGDSIARVS